MRKLGIQSKFPSKVRVSHIFFEDDILLFARAQTDQEILIMQVLDEFAVASRLKVNIRKSKVFCCWNVSRNMKEQIMSITSITVCPNLGKYLGSHYSMVE